MGEEWGRWGVPRVLEIFHTSNTESSFCACVTIALILTVTTPSVRSNTTISSRLYPGQQLPKIPKSMGTLLVL